MTNSYSGNPADSPKDAVRFWISDRAAPWQFSDEEIDYALGVYPSPISTAAALANELAMKYAAKVDKAVGDLRISYSQASKQYAALAADLKSQGDQAGPISLYAGGTSLADMHAVASNTDRPRDPFRRHQFDIPNAADSAVVPDPQCE